MTGNEAEKEFYRLRQKFGKERRKVVLSQTKSGAGADHVPYKLSWELYDDLMFLADHIQPRRTISNFQLSPSVVVAQQEVAASQISQLSSPSTSSTAIISDESSDLWNANLCETSIGSNSTTTETEKSSSTVDYAVQSFPISLTSTSKSVVSSKASTDILKAMASIINPKKETPLADNFKNKRKRGTAHEEVETAMIQSLKNISSLSSTLETAFKVISQPVQLQPVTSQLLEGCTSAIQGMIGSVILGLTKVPEKRQMDCLIAVLTCIKNFVEE